MSKNLNELILSSFFIALGIVTPMAFHIFGGAGPIFLPMHIPVLCAGFFLSWPFALAVGLMTPMLSSFLTGMPPVFPMMFIMMLELALYALSISLLKNILKNIYIKLIISMIIGRIGAGIAVFLLASFFAAKLPSPSIFVYGSILKGMPGILVQLIFIPAIVFSLKKFKPSLA